MPRQDEGRKKGTFSNIKLAITKKYVYPFSRKRMMQIGGLACAVVAVLFLFNAFFQKNSLFSEGPVSANHANFETECARCHQSFKEVSNAKCSICHEKANDKLGTYTFAAHYVYRSGDVNRAAAVKVKYQPKEIPCAACHPDHRGREAMITDVPDAKCLRCHEYGSFNKDHPQFEFVRNQIHDDSTLIFTHVRHTKEVLKKIGSVYVEQSCLYCHNPQPEGKGFKPINFDVHCAECHQPVALEDKSPKLTIKDPGTPDVPGVETLQMIQNRRGPGTLWSFYTNPNEFTIKGTGKVVKSPVYHKDPWILENLKQVRQTLYPDLGLADLTRTSGSISNKKTDQLYKDAIQTLQAYATGLRARPEPEVQAELMRIDSLLNAAQKVVGSYGRMLTDSGFSIENKKGNPNLTEAQRQAFEEFAMKIAGPCLECHMTSHASLLRVNTDQRVLHRAEFNHRAHILQRRCLECHTEIPINQIVVQGDTSKLLLARDKSATQNIPKIDNCYECHNAQEASNRCITCHFMHPNKDNRASLQLFVDKN